MSKTETLTGWTHEAPKKSIVQELQELLGQSVQVEIHSGQLRFLMPLKYPNLSPVVLFLEEDGTVSDQARTQQLLEFGGGCMFCMKTYESVLDLHSCVSCQTERGRELLTRLMESPANKAALYAGARAKDGRLLTERLFRLGRLCSALAWASWTMRVDARNFDESLDDVLS